MERCVNYHQIHKHESALQDFVVHKKHHLHFPWSPCIELNIAVEQRHCPVALHTCWYFLDWNFNHEIIDCNYMASNCALLLSNFCLKEIWVGMLVCQKMYLSCYHLFAMEYIDSWIWYMVIDNWFFSQSICDFVLSWTPLILTVTLHF